MSKVIGVDLGSTLSEVAVIEAGKPVIVVNDEGSRTTPSVISFKDGERKVGAAGKRQAIVSPKDTVVLVKRFMGGTYDEVKDSIKHVQYEVKNVGGKPMIHVADRDFTPEELSAMILTKMKATAEAYLGEDVKDAVITVPAFFDNAAKEATKRAGELAGLNVLRLVAEPTAAILASNIDMSKGGKYMVADIGGSTTDFSVADISDNVVEILASSGDVYCGGSDFDKLIADYLVAEFKKDNDVDISNEPMSMSRVMDAVEKAKVELSSTSTTEVNLPYLIPKDGIPLHMVYTLTRAKLEQLIDGITNHIIDCAKDALNKSGLKASELDGILLVGGTTRIPVLQEKISKAFNVELLKSVNPDEAVALGAAVQGGIISGDAGASDILLLDVTAIPYGIETMGGVMTTLVDANTTIPTGKEQIFTTAVDNQPSVTISVYQGFRPMVKDNKKIGEFNLDGILPAQRGVPQILVKFDIDANGILKVSATDKASGKEQHVTINDASGISQEDIERMKADAEKYAQEDKKAKETADVLNTADATIMSTEKQLNEYKDKLPADKKQIIEEKLSNLKEVYSKKDVDGCKSATEEVLKAFQEASSEMYKQAGAAGGTGGNGQPFDFMDAFNQAAKNGAQPGTKQNPEDVQYA